MGAMEEGQRGFDGSSGAHSISLIVVDDRIVNPHVATIDCKPTTLHAIKVVRTNF